MRQHQVLCLLMGGQACVFYGAAEFSRDADFAILADDGNLDRLRAAMDALGGGVIAVPPFEARYLARGHAVHFRCSAGGVEGMRVDVMARMRNVDEFPCLWERRTVLEIEGIEVDLMGLQDLVRAKMTQRDKDWPMIQRLVEAHWFKNRHEPTIERIRFWFRECRTPAILQELADSHRGVLGELAATGEGRCGLWELLRAGAGESCLAAELANEQRAEMDRDRAYWLPLKKELESLRRRK
jgi:hypothetical protein